MTLFEKAVVAANGGKVRGAQTRIAEQVRVKAASVNRWCRGKSVPEPDVREDLARALGLTVDKLMALFPAENTPPVAHLAGLVDVVGIVRADRFAVSFDGPPLDRIPNPYPGKRVFALRISGDCMEPTLHDGEDVYVLEDQVPKDKDVVVVLLDGEYTIKRYRILDGAPWLVPDNKKYKRLKIESNKLTIRGVVDGAYRRRL